MQRLRLSPAFTLRNLRWKGDDFGSSRNHTHDSIMPEAKFNPFDGGIQFPTPNAPFRADDFFKPNVFTNRKKMKFDPSTESMFKRHHRPKRLEKELASTTMHTPCTAESSTVERAEDLLKYDDAYGRREREVTARMAVRKLMSLHFHASRTAKLEEDLNKKEDLSLTTRFLSERQRLKEANATAAVLSGSTPIPTSSGVVSGSANYSSVTSKRLQRADTLSAKRAMRVDGGARTKGAFVATPENTAGLLQEAHKDVEVPDWTNLGTQNGRTLDDILNGGGVTGSHTKGDADVEEWADADMTTYESQASAAAAENDDLSASEYETDLEDARLGESSTKKRSRFSLQNEKKKRSSAKNPAK